MTSEIVWSVSTSSAVLENGKIKGVTPGRVLLQGKYGTTIVKVPVAVTDEITKVEVTPATMQLNIQEVQSVEGYRHLREWQNDQPFETNHMDLFQHKCSYREKWSR